MSVCAWDNCFRQTKEVHGAELRSYLRLVTIAWGFGAVFFGATGGTALPELAKTLGAPQFFFGLLGAAPFLGLVPQLPVSWLIERTGRRKWLFICTCTIHRLIFLAIAMIPFVVPAEWRVVRLSALILTLVGSWVLGGFAGPTWNGWMGDMIPSRIRGRYWAFRRRVGLITTMAAALIAGWFIDYSASTRLGTAGGIAMVFAIASLFGAIDPLLFMFIPEIPKRISQVRMTWGKLIASPLKDRAFLQLMLYWFLLNFANAGIIGTFFQRNLREVVRMENSWVNFVLVISPSIGWYMAVKWWGRARDRWGNRPILVLTSAAVVINPLLWCLVRPEWAWTGLVIPIYGGFVWAGIDMALCNALLGFSGGGRVSSYPALAAIISGLGGILGPLAAGVLGQWLGDWHIQIGGLTFVSYHLLFAIGAGLQLMTVPLALRIEEPEAHSMREVLRVLYDNTTPMTRVMTYIPRRVVSLPLSMIGWEGTGRPGPDLEAAGELLASAKVLLASPPTYPNQAGNGQNGISRHGSWRGSSSHAPRIGRQTCNNPHPCSYDDYIHQLIEMASREMEEHALAQQGGAEKVGP
jgi:MFS family permease